MGEHGIGARIWFDMARVGRACCETGPRLIAKRGEEAIGDVLRECVSMVKEWSASDRRYGEGGECMRETSGKVCVFKRRREPNWTC